MLLYGEDNGVVCHGEGVLLDTLDDFDESDLGGERVSVVDDWLAVRPVPAIHWYRSQRERGGRGGRGGRDERKGEREKQRKEEGRDNWKTLCVPFHFHSPSHSLQFNVHVYILLQNTHTT